MNSEQVRDDKVQIVPMSEIFADEDFNCRGTIAPIDVVDLARNIQEQGLIQPIVVQPYRSGPPGTKYRVVAGYRRHMAHKVNNAATISCIIRDNLSDDDARFLNLSENLNRQNLNLMQEARAIKRFLDEGYTQEMIREKLNVSRGWVQPRVYALQMPEPIQEEIQAGTFKVEHIHALHSLRNNPEQQMEKAKEIKEKKQRGERVRVAVSAKKMKSDPHEKMNRDRKAIQLMIEHIIKNVGGNFGSRCLAWANGEITTFELYQDIAELASDEGRDYLVPREDISTAI